MRSDSHYPGTSIPQQATRVFTGKIFDVYQWEQELYNGKKVIFEQLKRPDTVKVFPILPDNRILLLREQQPDRQEFIGLPGGRVMKNEEPRHAIARELLEETGYSASEYTLWNTNNPLSKIDWTVYTFTAKGLRSEQEPQLDGGEKITLMPVTFDELLDYVRSEQFEEVQLLRIFYEALLSVEKMNNLRKFLSA